MRIGINQSSFVDPTTGDRTVGISEDVLAKLPFYYEGEFGIGKHPESFSYFGIAKYCIDVNSGVVLRLSNDGLTAISKIYDMNDYFTEKCGQVLASASKVNIYGVYDIKFGEYIIAFSAIGEVAGETLAFNEEKNVWSTYYSYVPEMMCGNGLDIISFKNGGLWKHNTNALYNNFYGTQYK